MIEVEQTEAAFPLELTVDRDGSGLTGLTPTVAIRNAATLNSYLDFNDNTFKTTGWTTQYRTLAEVGRGHYHATVNLAALALAIGTKLSVEYRATASGSLGDSADLLMITRKILDASLARKYATNRLVSTSGNPGALVLYDDDAVTVLKTHQLRDESGAATLPASGVPANRTAGT